MINKPDISKILKWSEIHSFVVLTGAAASFYFGTISLLVMPVGFSFLYYLHHQREYLSQLKPFGGYANAVTLFRLLLMCLGGLFSMHWPNYLLFAFFTTAVLLDVLDGYLARRFRQSSDFGLYFDMETDAFFVALASLILYKKGLIDAWILFPGYLRYFYMMVWKLIPLEQKKEPKRRYASIIAGIFFVALLLPFLLPEYLYQWPLRIAGALIIGSFAFSFWYQMFTPASEGEVADRKEDSVHKNNPSK